MSTWPVIGRVIRIAAAVVRLPDLKQRQNDLDTVQLPALLQQVSELTTEFDDIKTAFSELDTEIPELKTALSEMKTEIPELMVRLSEINAEIPELKTELNHLKTESSAFDDKTQSLEQELSEHGSTIRGIDTQQPFQLNLLRSAPVAFRNITRDIVGLKAAQKNISESVDYLNNRLEFVRNELMYEMRYGASSITGEDNESKAKTEILSPEKLAAAREEQIRINLGCGHIPVEGYLNIDRRALPGIDIVAEVDELPFNTGEVDEIFSAHLLEHFPQEQLRRTLLKYWHGLLKPGGEFRAIVPDGDGMIAACSSGEYPFEQFRKVTYGAQDYDGDFHYNMFTPSSLSELLLEAGFVEPRILAANRENGGCKEFEISARRKQEE